MVYGIIGAILVGIGSVGLVLGYLSDLLKSKNIQNLVIKKSMNNTIENYRKKIIIKGIFAIFVIIGSVLLISWTVYLHFE